MKSSFDVVIVGGGPTGLLLGCELVLGGCSVVVLERLGEVDTRIKAAGLGALPAEVLERRGLKPYIDAVEERVERGSSAALKDAEARFGKITLPGPAARGSHAIGGHFAGLFLIDQTRQKQPQRRYRQLNQQSLETILNHYARSLGVDVRRSHEVTDFREEGSGVVLDVRTPDGPARMRGTYLVGCDGGRSFVRKHAGFEFAGTEPTTTGHQLLVDLDHPERLLPPGWRRTDGGMISVGLNPERMMIVEFDGAPPDRDAPITVEELTRRVRRVSGADVNVVGIQKATRFTDHVRQATTYRRGRIFLAGDSAHVHPPFGGPGLTLGLLDAANLGWKLVAAVKGWASRELLDTYTSERHPVAARVLQNTRAQVALMRPDPQSGAMRDIVAAFMELDEGQQFFGELVSGITTRYDLGDPHPLVGRMTDDRPVYVGRAASRLYDQMHDGRAVLIDVAGKASKRAKRWASRVRTVQAKSGLSALVRPDGCIAWARKGDDVSGLDDALVRWFGEPPVAASSKTRTTERRL